jgi:hypothetical protein
MEPLLTQLAALAFSICGINFVPYLRTNKKPDLLTVLRVV